MINTNDTVGGGGGNISRENRVEPGDRLKCNYNHGGTTSTTASTTIPPARSSSSSSPSLEGIEEALPQSRRESEAEADAATTTSLANKSNDEVSATTTTSTSTTSNIEIKPIVVTQQSSISNDHDDDIAAITKGLGGVSLSTPSKELTPRHRIDHNILPSANDIANAPEAIKNLATMLSSKGKYTNIVVLTGERGL